MYCLLGAAHSLWKVLYYTFFQCLVQNFRQFCKVLLASKNICFFYISLFMPNFVFFLERMLYAVCWTLLVLALSLLFEQLRLAVSRQQQPQVVFDCSLKSTLIAISCFSAFSFSATVSCFSRAFLFDFFLVLISLFFHSTIGIAVVFCVTAFYSPSMPLTNMPCSNTFNPCMLLSHCWQLNSALSMKFNTR